MEIESLLAEISEIYRLTSESILTDFGEYIDLLPMSTDDSFKKHRRFFYFSPTILLLRIDDSFRKHRRLFFKSPWMLGEVS